MNYNDVNIYECHFFNINNTGKLQFTRGNFTGKTSNDFNTISKLREVFSYCFWIMHTKETPLVSKYLASVFMNELTPKIYELEKKLNRKLRGIQKKLTEETESSTKVVGTIYGKAN
jgi:hypothetical protein